MKKILDKINQKINHARHSNIFLHTSDNSEPVFILKFNSSIRSNSISIESNIFNPEISCLYFLLNIFAFFLNSNISMLYRSLLERFLIFFELFIFF